MNPITTIIPILTPPFPRHNQIIQVSLGLSQKSAVVNTSLYKERTLAFDIETIER